MAVPQISSDRQVERVQLLVPSVVEAMVDRIHSGDLPPGAVVPKEATLCEEYGVSRTVIREALRIMQEKGLVDIKQGRGTEVAPMSSWNLMDPMIVAAQVRYDPTLTVIGQLIAVRAAVESSMAHRAALVMDDAGRSRLRELIAVLGKSTKNPERYLDTDREFHEVILRAAGNPFATVIINNALAWTRCGPTHEGVTAKRIKHSQLGHAEICERILAGDADGAADAMSRHVLQAWELKRAQMLAMEKANSSGRLARTSRTKAG